jgi:hypothetical protein
MQEAAAGLEDDAAPETFNEKQLLNRVERFRLERDGGRQVYELLDPIEWELLLIYDERYAAYRRSHELRVATAFETLLALTTRQ